MQEEKLSPFALTKGRIVLLVLGAVLVLIAMGGMSSYQQLKEASVAAQAGATETPAR